ncbi:Fc receptor-like protein 5, partial [Astyanax mexicanus]
RASLTVDPDSTVFTGESVTLKCEITGYDGWRFKWYDYRGGRWAAVPQSGFYTVNSNTLTIRVVPVINGDQYRCRGEQSNRPKSSQYSNSVTLTVKERPTAVVTINPANQVFRGESVTLRCDLQGGGGFEWTYSWYKGNPVSLYSSTQEYEISPVEYSHSGKYSCRGTVRGTSRSSHTSTAVRLTVSGELTLIVSPSRSQHFTTGSLSLICEGQSNSTGWRVRRYSHSERKVSDCSSGWGSVTGSTCNISSLLTSHTGVYWCESESGGRNNHVNITVSSESALFLLHYTH